MTFHLQQLCTDCVPLTYITHLSVTQSVFPEELKLAKVLPIYKNDDEHLLKNYRPISVLPFYSKIIERVIYNNLLLFIETNNILYDKQIGFQKYTPLDHHHIVSSNRLLPYLSALNSRRSSKVQGRVSSEH